MRRIVFRSEHYRRYYFEVHAQLREGALNQFSPECGPWANMCMSQHRRCAANYFLGDESFEFVRKANRQMAVVALMLFLTSIAGCIGTLEQSLTSSMHKAPPMRTVLAYIGATRITTSHGAFGGSTTKLLQLFSSSKVLLKMMKRATPKRRSMTTLVSRRDGKFTGKAKAMKNSQHYTAAYGLAFAEAFMVQRDDMLLTE